MIYNNNNNSRKLALVDIGPNIKCIHLNKYTVSILVYYSES